jgi:hypothetical protein
MSAGSGASQRIFVLPQSRMTLTFIRSGCRGRRLEVKKEEVEMSMNERRETVEAAWHQAKTSKADEEICTEINSALLELVRLMNWGKSWGISSDFGITTDKSGSYIHEIRFTREIVLEHE